MCGIYASIGKRTDAAQAVLTGLKILEYRGYDSWGVAYKEEGKSEMSVQKQVGKIGDAVIDSEIQSGIAIGHTRWATHGGVTQANAHPHLDCSKRLALVHNGIVENYTEIKASLIAKGHVFLSETDSEVVIHAIEEACKSVSLQESVRMVFQALSGLNALVVSDAQNEEIVIVKRGSPLVLGKGDNTTLLASDQLALAGHVQDICFLPDDVLVHLTKDSIVAIEVADNLPIDLAWEQIRIKADDVSMGEFKHFTIKEICEQPGILAFHANNRVFPEFSDGEIYFVGCGTAGVAGLFGSYAYAHYQQKHVSMYSGSEFEAFLPTVQANATVVFFSQSGETIDLVQHAQKLKAKGVRIIAVVNRTTSTLARLADQVIPLEAGPEQSVLSTKAFTAKMAVLLQMASANGAGVDIKKAADEIATITSAPYIEEHIQPISKVLSTTDHVFCLGREAYYPLALESAIKIKEITYIHAEGMAAGELKHGPLALITDGTPCIVFVPQGEGKDAMLSSTMEVKSRGGMIVGIAAENNPVFDWHIPVADCGMASPIAQITVIQLLAYTIAVELGRDPDKPRNLAKSVTVR
ncbi:MAG: glutamine--fructose-6-phosphate transaminase (isomerizing) [Candidatus Woesebacteria bacterium]